MKSYRELIVWQKAIDLVVACYELTKGFPDDEKYGLTSQLRRAAVSVPANIAEGHGRGTTSAFLNFLWIANGSLTEVETHLIIAGRLGYISRDVGRPIYQQIQEIGRMLSGLRRSLQSSDDEESKGKDPKGKDPNEPKKSDSVDDNSSS